MFYNVQINTGQFLRFVPFTFCLTMYYQKSCEMCHSQLDSQISNIIFITKDIF